MKDRELFSALSACLSRPVRRDEPLSRYTTWRLGGPADFLAEPVDEQELAAVLTLLHGENTPWMVIGNGSNLLVGDRGFRGVVIRLAEAFSHCHWQGDVATVQAGALLASLAQEAAERSRTGLEFARGIPGSVGGGVRMNAGAYGHFLGEYVIGCRGIAYNGGAISLDRADISFSYRESSLFQVPAVITQVSFNLRPGEKDEIFALMRELQQRRAAAQPLDLPSCGSVFRNPPGDHAGYLIERAGLRGLAIGGMQVSEKHGNFIVNRGGGAAAEARQLIELVQEKIWDFAQVRLEPEVRLVGEFD